LDCAEFNRVPRRHTDEVPAGDTKLSKRRNLMKRVRARAGHRLAGWGLLGLAFLLLAGCGPPSGTVSGKVTIGGKTVPRGSVAFVPPNGKGTRTSEIAEDGTYTVRNLPPGKAAIIVETKSAAPPSAPGGVRMNMPAGAPNAPGADAGKRYVPIPEKYSQAGTSGLSLEVKTGKQEYNIDLKSK
jgi:hypothetical protein